MNQLLGVVFLSAALAYTGRADEPKALELQGTVQPRRLVALTSAVPGRIAEVIPEEGSTVKEGEILVRLDPRAAQAARRVAEAKLKLRETRQREARTVMERDVARAELEIANAELEQAVLELERHVVLAPFAGVVTRVHVRAGEFTNPLLFGLASSAALCEVADLSAVFVDALSSEAQANQLSVGQVCEVRLDSQPTQRLAGKIERLGRVVERGNVAVRVKLERPPTQVRINAAATVRIPLQK